MTEYIYKLDFPDIRAILLENKYDELFTEQTVNITNCNLNLEQYLKPEFRTLNSYRFDKAILFYKSDRTGVIHTDGGPTWALNYVVTGTGVMRYYDPTKLGQPQILRDNPGNARPVYDNTDIEFEKSYDMPVGIYLTRVDLPHVVIGYEKRYCLSMRTTIPEVFLPWEFVVDSFSDYII
jgi:hypothetical protein